MSLKPGINSYNLPIVDLIHSNSGMRSMVWGAELVSLKF